MITGIASTLDFGLYHFETFFFASVGQSRLFKQFWLDFIHFVVIFVWNIFIIYFYIYYVNFVSAIIYFLQCRKK